MHAGLTASTVQNYYLCIAPFINLLSSLLFDHAQSSRFPKGAWLVKLYIIVFGSACSTSAMGQGESVPSCQELVKNDLGDFVVISNSLPDEFKFEPSESQVVAFGIDKQSDPKFMKKSLTFITVDDAKQVLNAFVRVGAVWSENARLFSASKNPECCTTSGMKKTFQYQQGGTGWPCSGGFQMAR